MQHGGLVSDVNITWRSLLLPCPVSGNAVLRCAHLCHARPRMSQHFMHGGANALVSIASAAEGLELDMVKRGV